MLHSSPTKSQAIFGPMNLQWLSMKAWLHVFGHPSFAQDTRETQVEGTFAF